MPRDIDFYGQDVTDEQVAIDTAEVIDSTTYYTGFLDEIAANSILGIVNPDYGIYTAASGGGTRFLVKQVDILPTDSDPGTGSPPDLAIDIRSGKLYSTVSQTVYATYLGHGSVPRASSAAAAASGYIIDIPIVGLVGSSNVDVHIEKPYEALRLTKYQIINPPQGGMVPSGGATLHARNWSALDGDGTDDTAVMTISGGTRNSDWQDLQVTPGTDPLIVPTSKKLVLNVQTANIANLLVRLRHEPA